MFSTENSIIVPYTTEQMFNLVNDISSYSDFIPGCIYSCVLIDNNYELTAQIDIFKFGINQSFITHNVMIKNKSIVINLVDGPLKSLFGNWRFIYLKKTLSEIQYSFSCEFHTKYIEKIFHVVIANVINDIMQSFILRANKIYKYSNNIKCVL